MIQKRRECGLKMILNCRERIFRNFKIDSRHFTIILKSILDVFKFNLDVFKSILDVFKSILEVFTHILDVFKSILKVFTLILGVFKSIT